MEPGADPAGDDEVARDMVEQLAATGRVAVLETRGRVTLRPIRTAIGFVREPDGSLLVAAGDPGADWARNLHALPACAVRIGDDGWFAHAEPLEGDERARAIAGLIIKYGTPAERLGAGPAFRLRPAVNPASDDGAVEIPRRRATNDVRSLEQTDETMN